MATWRALSVSEEKWEECLEHLPFTKTGQCGSGEEATDLSFDTANQGRARTQSPTTRNYAVEIPTFGEFAGVSTAGVQWLSLALGEPPA